MALTATFEANFDSFYNAVQKAEVSLKSFEGNANKVSSSLNRMADSLSGRKMIQDATLMATAVEKIGGVSKLTETELIRVGARAQEAIAKMKLMGVEVPPGLQKIADATKNVGTAAAGSTTLLSSMERHLARMFTVGAVVAFGRELLRMGDDIVRVSDRTGLFTDEVQRLSFIAKQSGNSLDELVGAIGQLQNRLASGDTSAVGAVKALGISFTELRAAGPYQQLQLIADAVGKIPDPAGRAQVAMDLFGRAGIAILPTLQAEFRKLGDAAPVMAYKTVLALDQAGDALDKFQLQIKVWAAGSYNLLGKFFDQFSALVLRTTAGFLDVTANIASVFQNLKFPGADKLFPGLASGLEDVRKRAQFARDAARLLTTATGDMGTQVRKATPLFTDLGDSMKGVEKAAKDSAREAKAAHEALLAMSKAGLGSEFEWQREIEFTKFKVAKLAVVESQLFDQRGDFVEFMSRHKGEMFPELPPATLESWKAAQTTFTETALQVPILDQSLDRLATSFAQLAQVSDGAMGEIARDIGRVVVSMQLGTEAAKSMTAGFTQINDGSKAEGFVKLAAGIMTAVAALDAATNSTSRFKNVLGGAATGAKMGASVGGGAGAIVGAGIGALVGWAKSNSMEGRTVSPIRDEFFKLAGGLEKLNPLLQHFTGNFRLVDKIFKASTIDEYNAALADLQAELGRIAQLTNDITDAHVALAGKMGGLLALTPEMEAAFARAYDTQTPEDFLAALNDINLVLDDAKKAHDDMTAAAGRYGITIDGMGKAWQQQELNTKARELLSDYELLTKGGADHIAVVKGMGKSVDDYIDKARKMGIEVPSSMKPMLEEMIRAGKLTDDEGRKIKDLEGLGVKFGDSMEVSMGKVATALERLILLLETKLGPAIQNVPDGDFTIRGKVVMPDKLPKGYDIPDVEPMAAGGRGVVNKPTLFMAGEAGSEEFAFSGANKRFGEGEATDMSGVTGLLSSIQRQLEKNAREQPFITAMAVKDAITH